MTIKNIIFLCISSLLINIKHSRATTYYYFWRFEGTGITEGYLGFQNIGQQYPDTLSVSQSQNFNNYFPNHDQVVAGGDLSTWSITGGYGFGWSGTEILASEF